MSMLTNKTLRWIAALAASLALGLTFASPAAAQEEEPEEAGGLDISGLVQEIIVDASGGDATAAAQATIEGDDATATVAASAVGGNGGNVTVTATGNVASGEDGVAGADGEDDNGEGAEADGGLEP